MTLRCQNKMSRAIRKPAVCLDVKIKALISCTVTAQSIIFFVSALSIIFYIPSAFKIQNFEPQVEYSTRFVSDMIGNLEDRFSNDSAKMIRM